MNHHYRGLRSVIVAARCSFEARLIDSGNITQTYHAADVIMISSRSLETTVITARRLLVDEEALNLYSLATNE